MEDGSAHRQEPRLVKSHSLAERPLLQDLEHTRSHSSYDFLAALRRTDKLTAERIDTICKSLKLPSLPIGLYQYALKITQFQKAEETKMIQEVAAALRDYIRYVEIPEQSDVYRALGEKVANFQTLTGKFVEDSEIIANFMRYTGRVIAALQSKRVSIPKAKNFIDKMLEKWVSEKIKDSERFIIDNTVELIQEGETILIYGYSDLLRNLLKTLHNQGKNIHVIYAAEIDNDLSKQFVASLAADGVQITFTTINGVPYFMKKLSKIFMGAITMYSNGSMLGISGSAMIAAYGANFRKPCYVLCETYKFSEKSKIDGLIVNRGIEWVTEVAPDSFNKIALSYDLTPSKFISLVISEVEILPPISVSVVLREFYSYDEKSIAYNDNL